MKVAVVTAVYPPEPVVSSRTSADVASALHAAGDEVTVICPYPSRPAGVLYPGYRRRWRSVETTAVPRSSSVPRVPRVPRSSSELLGRAPAEEPRNPEEPEEPPFTPEEPPFTTIRTFSTLSPRSTLASRFAENLSFGLSAAWTLLRLRGVDVIYLNTWPVFATAMAAAVARLKGVPYVVSVQDVYPESLFVQQRRGAGTIGRLLRRIDRWVAKGAAALIVLSEHFAAIYRDDRGIDAARIRIVPNWIAENSVVPDPAAGRAYRQSRGIPDGAFVVCYGGNIGVAAAVEQLIEAWRYVDSPDVHLLIAGSGTSLAACEALAREIAPGRVHFHSPWPLEENTPVLAAADVLALPTLGDQSLISVPSKLLSYLLAAKPVLASVLPRSETAKILRARGIGWSVEPGAPRQLAAAIQVARGMSTAERMAMGEAARRVCIEAFGRDHCVGQVVATLREARGVAFSSVTE